MNKASSTNRIEKGIQSNGFGRTERSVDKSQQQFRKSNTNYLVYEDPAAQLNINEDQWNSIVQKNLQNFNDEREKAKNDKLMQNKVIQMEQLKQIKDRQEVERKLREQEKVQFNKEGINSSDVYYVNYDKKQDQIKNAKGGSRHLGAELHKQHVEQLTEGQIRRRQEEV